MHASVANDLSGEKAQVNTSCDAIELEPSDNMSGTGERDGDRGRTKKRETERQRPTHNKHTQRKG